jgi:pyruvate dehydrogenase E2 component (dihydrolipoamide acetyltransferase)
MAEEAGIDLSRIKGSGPDGRVLERDVQEATAARPAPAPPGIPAVPAPGAAVPLSRMLSDARRMARQRRRRTSTSPSKSTWTMR